jgi:CHAT domain-containing protein
LIKLPDTGRAIIERWSKQVQRGARFSNVGEFEPPLAAAYSQLIAPVLKEIKEKPQRLIFCPDGAMHGLPFKAFYDSTKRQRQYLLELAPIEMAGSAQLYLLSLRRDRELVSSTNRSILLVGDPAFDQGLPEARDLKPLPNTRREVDRIRALYAPDAKVLVDTEATPSRVLDLALDSSILHIAAHSIPDADAPFRSLILLAPSANESGVLYAHDLLTKFAGSQMRLVVLASCSSAGGLPVGPEGVAPLVRPLIGAGVPAVIGTLWKIEDATAEALFVSFHQHYRKGEDAAVALRNAQLEMLRSENNAGFRSARAWGAVQVIGHGSSPFAPPPQQKEKPP